MELQVGTTALHAAISTKGKVFSSRGNVTDWDLAVLLIEAGADVDLKDKVRRVCGWLLGCSNECYYVTMAECRPCVCVVAER